MILEILRALKDVIGLKNIEGAQINPAKEDGNLALIKAKTDNLDVALSAIKTGTDRIPLSPSTEATLNALLVVLQHLINSPLGRLTVDSAGRLRILIDAAGTATPVTQSGTWSVAQSGTWNLGNFPVDQRWEIIQRANIEYNECQRSKFTFA